MPIQRSSHCRFEYGKEYVNSAMICTGITGNADPAGPCKVYCNYSTLPTVLQGDSGGALACTSDTQVFTLDGVISSGSLICMRKHAVATRVDNPKVYEWINGEVILYQRRH